MTVNVYDLGDMPRLKGTFTVDGVATDPTAVALIVRDPAGTKLSYLSSTGFASQGNWDANGNSPVLADGTGTAGHYYTVSVAGTQNLGSGSQTFAVGDHVYYDGETWVLLPAPQTATLTKEATGIFYYDLPLHLVGDWYYRFEGAGAVHAASETRFKVRSSQIR